MNSIEICIAFVAAIVSVGTPLIFQVISKFDEKYHSEKIMELFKKESFQKIFIIQIIVVTSLSLLYIVASLLYCETDFLKFSLLWKIVSFLLIFLSFTLIAQFIYFSLVVLKFSVPSDFIKRRSDKLRKTGKIENIEYYKVISDLFVFSVRFELIDTCNLMPDYMFYVFKNYGNSIVEKFPEEYYTETQRIAEEIALKKNARLVKLNDYATGFKWYFPSGKINFNNKNFDSLWVNLKKIIEFKNDEIIISYWRQAFHFIQYDLSLSDPIYDAQSPTKKINQKEIDPVTEMRNEFIEFHYYLGSLLLYENRINCILRIWSYTTSEPPKYPLLPKTLEEIFSEYFKACNYFENNRWEKSVRFGFPKIEVIHSESLIDSWYRKYFLLLFLRQYTLSYNINFVDPLQIPTPPTGVKELKYQLEKISRLEDELERLLNSDKNQKLLKELKLNFITKEWCSKQQKQYPLDLIDTYKRNLKLQQKEVKESQNLLPEKIDQFYNRSTDLIKNTFNEYFNESVGLFIDDSSDEYKRSLRIKNYEQIQDREPFVDDSISSLNFDSFHAGLFLTDLKVLVSESFLIPVTKQYLFKEEDIFPAIKGLRITDQPYDFIIVCFQQSISFYKSVYNVSQLTDSDYCGVKIYNFGTCNPELVSGTFFILKKEHRPIIKFKETSNEFQSNSYHSKKILEKYNITASIVDLKHEPFRQVYKEKYPNYNLENSVLTIFEMDAEICWKDDAKVIAIRVASANKNLGIPNKLEEIKPFDKD